MVEARYPRGGDAGSGLNPAFAKAMQSHDSKLAIAYLEAGLSGLRIAPAALGTAALALPVAINASGGSLRFGWFVAGGAAALVGVAGLSGAAYKSAVDLDTEWITPDRMMFVSYGSTFLAALLLFFGVEASL